MKERAGEKEGKANERKDGREGRESKLRKEREREKGMQMK